MSALENLGEPEDSLEAKLYQIIDDIDTASDMFKPEISGYERYVFRKVKEARKYITSDGYKLYYQKKDQGNGIS